jgi:hypothetical protein
MRHRVAIDIREEVEAGSEPLGSQGEDEGAVLDSEDAVDDASDLTTGMDELKGMTKPSTLLKIQVGLKVEPVTDLNYDTSPCPLAVEQCYKHARTDAVDVDILWAKFSEASQAEVLRYFPDAKSFVTAHQNLLALLPPSLVILAIKKDQYERNKLSPEQQLRHAIETGAEGKIIRRLQRQVMLFRFPESPLKEDDALIDAIVPFLPERGFIDMKKFVREVLPQDISWWLPEFGAHFFKEYPEKVTMFEWKVPNALYLKRPELPLPSGALRTSFSEAEILRLVAAMVQHRPLTSSAILGRLPFAVREQFRQSKKPLVPLLQEYPQYFTLVFRDTIRFDPRGVVVTLIQNPP